MKLDFDPEIDPPATIAVIGAGPIGIEAALYGRILGYSLLVVDTVSVGGSLRPWTDWPLTGSWNQLTSSLGLASLEAQGKPQPGGDEIPTVGDYLEQYLKPLARTDLLRESIQIQSSVRSISRLGCPAEANISTAQRSELEFRLLIESRQRGFYSQLADIILDCGGLARRSGLAPGGGLAIGEAESALSPALHLGKRDILGKHRTAFQDRHCLLWGNNLEACANAIELSQLIKDSPHTRLTWILPKHLGTQPRFSIPAERASLLEQIDALSKQQDDRFQILEAWGIEAIRLPASQDAEGETETGPTQLALRLQSSIEETLDIVGDVFLNCASRLPDWNMAAALPSVGLSPKSGDQAGDVPSWLTAEPHYYVLGAKSQVGWADGRRSNRIVEATGVPSLTTFEQIREVYALIGGRTNLNLYESF